MAALVADREQIARFAAGMFKYATRPTFVSLRSFTHERGTRPARISAVKLNGGDDLTNLVDAVEAMATEMANVAEGRVVAPPICTFVNPRQARETDIHEGIALSVDLDEQPLAGRKNLEDLLGPATFVVATGGIWRNPATSEDEDKLHIHWLLAVPTRDAAGHALLKEARRAAAALVGGDESAAPINHPLRWPGTYHTKDLSNPRLATIVSETDREVALEDAAANLSGLVNAKKQPFDARKSEANIAAGIEYHFSTFNLLVHWRHRERMTRAAAQVRMEKLYDDAGAETKGPGWRGERAHIADMVKDIYDRKDNRRDDPNRPIVRIVAGELSRMVDEAEAALVATQGELYRQVNRIVRPVWDKVSTSAGNATQLRISEVQPAHLHERFSEVAYFEKCSKKKDGGWEISRTDCPNRVVDAYLARDGSWRLRPLLGVVTAPTLRPDGTILETPGYDVSSALLFNPCGVEFPEVPANPTKEDARRALKVLKEPIKDVPFVTEHDMAVALSGIITAVIRRALPVAPIHAFTSPTAGTGKSLLVDVASMIATGERAAVTSMGRDKYGDAELEKRLVSSYLAGDPVIAIDNIEGPLGGEFLCQISSQHFVKLRALGKSINVMVPNTSALYATGNNLTIVGDLTRRVLLADIDAKVERPELREFTFDPIEYSKAHRAELVMAALTVVRAWLVSGETARDKPLGGYREWSALVRDPLIWLGVADPVDTMEKTRLNDPRLDKLRTVIGAWRVTFAEREVTVREMTEAFGRVLPPTELDPDVGRAHANADLRAALLSVADNGRGEVQAEKLSWWLRKNEGRPVRLAEGEPSYRIVKGDGAKRDRWKVEDVGQDLFAQVGQ